MIPFDDRVAKNALAFLKRINLSGEEVPAYTEVMGAIDGIYRMQKAKKEAAEELSRKMAETDGKEKTPESSAPEGDKNDTPAKQPKE